VALLAATSGAGRAWAADKETRQMMADIRILQEQSQQLQNLIAILTSTLGDAVKAVNARLDDQTNISRKSLADQKLVIDAIANDLRVLREKVDDNNVRVGSIGQELDALRQSVAALNAPRPFGADADAAVPPDSVPPPSGAAGVGASPQKLLDGARADYYAGQYDLAALGFDSYVKTFPQSPQAPDAQLHIGNSYMNRAKYDKAVEAYDGVIRNYPRSAVTAEAHAKKGLALMNLKDYEKAREALDFVVKNYPPDNAAVIYAQQRLRDLQQITAPKR
jgi:tol-pal system protein YbgF